MEADKRYLNFGLLLIGAVALLYIAGIWWCLLWIYAEFGLVGLIASLVFKFCVTPALISLLRKLGVLTKWKKVY